MPISPPRQEKYMSIHTRWQEQNHTVPIHWFKVYMLRIRMTSVETVLGVVFSSFFARVLHRKRDG